MRNEFLRAKNAANATTIQNQEAKIQDQKSIILKHELTVSALESCLRHSESLVSALKDELKILNDLIYKYNLD